MIDAFNNWRLSKKLSMTFLAIAAVMGIMAGASILAMGELGTIATRHVERGIAGTDALGRLLTGLREHRVIIYSQMTAVTAEQEQKYYDRFSANKKLIDLALADYSPLAGEFEPQVQSLKATVAKLADVNARIFALRRTEGGAAAMSLIQGEGKQVSDSASEEAKKLIEMQKARAKASNDAGRWFASEALWLIVTLTLAGMIALFVIWRLLAKTVASPMAELTEATRTLAEGGKSDVPHRGRMDELGDVAGAVEHFRLAAVSRAEADAQAAATQRLVTTTLRQGLAALSQGDLTASINTDFPKEFAELKDNFNEALASLSVLIASVSESAQVIQTGSGEIAQASEDLARRTEANAASIEETAAAVTQMDGRLRATAVSAAQTVERADGAISTVTSGRTIADKAVDAMTRVSESARGIDDVIEGLDKIAFQTRVLAMNAAVEAGRAGEAGRGFAVVADLVSALAMRAEEEAGRAREQLTSTQTDIVAAVDMVQKVDLALANIAGDVEEVHSLLGAIATDNQVQSTAISQISVAIGTMDQSTQQNAAMVEETSAAARNLSNEVAVLSEQTVKFKVGATRPKAFRPRSSTAQPLAIEERSSKIRAAFPGEKYPGNWNDF